MNATHTTLSNTVQTNPADSSKSGDVAGLRRDIALVAVVICLAAAIIYIVLLRSRLSKLNKNKSAPTTDKAAVTSHNDVVFDPASQPKAAIDLESGVGRIHYNSTIRPSRPWRDTSSKPWRSAPHATAQTGTGENDYWPSFPARR